MELIELKWWLMEKKVELIEKENKPNIRTKVSERCYINGEIAIVNQLLEKLKDVSIYKETKVESEFA